MLSLAGTNRDRAVGGTFQSDRATPTTARLRSRFVRLLVLVVFAAVANADDGCSVSDSLLDVSKFPGPGANHEQPRVAASCEGDEVVVTSNSMPHYEFVQVTPRPLTAQDHTFRIPRKPALAEEPTSIPFLGPVGFAVNGVVFFGPNEGPVPAVERYGDPIFNSIMDECLGHTANEYHYHAFYQPCLTNGSKEGQRSPVLGYGFDGFAIRGPYGCVDEECSEVVRMQSGYNKIGDPSINAWEAYRWEAQEGPEFLDRCNGHTGPGEDYHYHSTNTFPYIIGCYSGTPTLDQARGGPPDVTQRRDRRPAGAGRRGPGGAQRRAPGGAPGRGRGGPGGLAAAAPRLGLSVEQLAAAIDETELRSYLRDPENVHFDFATPARKLNLNEESLRQALEHQVSSPIPYRGHRPGCTVTEEGYLLCHPSAVRGLVDQVQKEVK